MVINKPSQTFFFFDLMIGEQDADCGHVVQDDALT